MRVLPLSLRRISLKRQARTPSRQTPSPTPLGIREPERTVPGADGHPRPAALSLSQETSLLFQELAIQSGAVRFGNDFARIFRARRHLDVAILEECLRIIISRHSSLRTAFRPSESVAGSFRSMQLAAFSRTRVFLAGLHTGTTYPAESLSVPLSTIDTSQAASETGQVPSLEDLIWRESSQRLALDTPPAFRVCLIDSHSGDQTLLLVMSHLVFDGWSVRLFVNELTTLYMTGANGALTSLPTVASQYQEFAEHQRRRLANGAFRADLSYWVSEWNRPDRGTIPHRELRFASTGTAPERANARESRRLSEPETASIRDLLKTVKITPYIFFRTALTIVLHHYTARGRIGLWTNFANRRDPEFEHTIGCFANSHFVAVDVAATDSCDDLYQRTTAAIAAGQEHEEVPRMAVSQQVGWRDEGNAAITFDTLPRLADDQLRMLEPLRMDAGGFEWVDLALRVGDEGSSFVLVAMYASGRYTADGIAELLQHVAEVALALTTDAQLTVSDCTSRMTNTSQHG